MRKLNGNFDVAMASPHNEIEEEISQFTSLQDLPRPFLIAMKTLFDIMDDQKVGVISLNDIDQGWKGKNKYWVLESLKKVAQNDGLLNFECFCRGLKVFLLSHPSKSSTNSDDTPSTSSSLHRRDDIVKNNISSLPRAATVNPQSHTFAESRSVLPPQSSSDIQSAAINPQLHHSNDSQGVMVSPRQHNPHEKSTNSSSSRRLHKYDSLTTGRCASVPLPELQQKREVTSIPPPPPYSIRRSESTINDKVGINTALVHPNNTAISKSRTSSLPQLCPKDLPPNVAVEPPQNISNPNMSPQRIQQNHVPPLRGLRPIHSTSALENPSKMPQYAAPPRTWTSANNLRPNCNHSRTGTNLLTVCHHPQQYRSGPFHNQIPVMKFEPYGPNLPQNMQPRPIDTRNMPNTSVESKPQEPKSAPVPENEPASEPPEKPKRGNNGARKILNKRREPRRHTVASGIDYNMLKRMKQLEQERDVLLQGLEVVERAWDWYLRKIGEIQEKMRFIGKDGYHTDYSTDAYQERLNFLMARIFEVNQHLSSLVENSEKGFPLHMNLAVHQPLLFSRTAQENHNGTLRRLKDQNHLLTEEVSKKSTKITQLEHEKSALIRELFQARSQNCKNEEITFI